MTMGVGMLVACRIILAMRMLMMQVMRVFMTVLHRLVFVIVLMPLGDVQPDAQHHERGGDQ